jgi:class 3 adenylate cyclase
MSGHPALLKTDLVDSTRLAEELGDAAMSTLWEAHDRAARKLLREWRGREIDKSDGFLLVFVSASDAVGYAQAYHRALAALSVPLKARAGLHVGPVISRQNPSADVALGAKPLEVAGIAVSIAARAMSLALGGQTLLTAAAKSALGATTTRLLSHGHWRMKGLEEPIELFEVGEADAPFTPPPDASKVYRVFRQGELWLPLAQIRHTLPAERDAFVGRKEALQHLAQRIDTAVRLISVIGTGGTGKTRFVQRFGWTWLGDFPGGVWFCDLSQAHTLDGIVHAVAQGLEVQLGRADPVAQLGNALAGRGRCLVILDNFEQVARCAEQTVGQWLERAREAHFIVTTREVLGIAGEETLNLAPLAPMEAASLFQLRAGAVNSDFASTAEDRVAIDRSPR